MADLLLAALVVIGILLIAVGAILLRWKPWPAARVVQDALTRLSWRPVKATDPVPSVGSETTHSPRAAPISRMTAPRPRRLAPPVKTIPWHLEVEVPEERDVEIETPGRPPTVITLAAGLPVDLTGQLGSPGEVPSWLGENGFAFLPSPDGGHWWEREEHTAGWAWVIAYHPLRGQVYVRGSEEVRKEFSELLDTLWKHRACFPAEMEWSQYGPEHSLYRRAHFWGESYSGHVPIDSRNLPVYVRDMRAWIEELCEKSPRGS